MPSDWSLPTAVMAGSMQRREVFGRWQVARGEFLPPRWRRVVLTACHALTVEGEPYSTPFLLLEIQVKSTCSSQGVSRVTAEMTTDSSS